MDEFEREMCLKDALELINKDSNVNQHDVDQEWRDALLEQLDSGGPCSVNQSDHQNNTPNSYPNAAPVNNRDSTNISHDADPFLGQEPNANATYTPTEVSKLQAEGRSLIVIGTYNVEEDGSLCTSQEIDKMVCI